MGYKVFYVPAGKCLMIRCPFFKKKIVVSLSINTGQAETSLKRLADSFLHLFSHTPISIGMAAKAGTAQIIVRRADGSGVVQLPSGGMLRTVFCCCKILVLHTHSSIEGKFSP